jgi:ATP synthase subunit 6
LSFVGEISRYLLCLRGLMMLAVVVAACVLAVQLGAHHGSNPDVFQQLFSHLKPGPLEWNGKPIALHAPWLPGVFTHSAGVEGLHENGYLVLTNLQLFQLAAVLCIVIGFSGVTSYLRTGRGDAWSRMFAGFVHFIREEMVYAVMGKHHGHAFTPYFLCVFFFILFQNAFGLLPHGATATASVAVTAALASTTLLAMIGCGMVAQGPLAFWMNLVPHVPLALWPLMFVVELIGLCVKPFALTIRLFANMTAGHLIVLSCMGLILFFAKGGANSVAGWGSAPLCVAFAAFIMIIETFVAVLQAYIFTMLSIIFVNASVHPEH